MSNNTYVEHSIARFENGKTVLGTSFMEGTEYSLNISYPMNGNLVSYDHSHPLGSGPSPPDIEVAGIIKNIQKGTNPTFRIYSPLTGEYIGYDENTLPVIELEGPTITVPKK